MTRRFTPFGDSKSENEEPDEIATAQLAIERQVEEREVAGSFGLPASRTWIPQTWNGLSASFAPVGFRAAKTIRG